MNALLFAYAFFSLPSPVPSLLSFLSILMTRLFLAVGWSPMPEVEWSTSRHLTVPKAGKF